MADIQSSRARQSALCLRYRLARTKTTLRGPGHNQQLPFAARNQDSGLPSFNLPNLLHIQRTTSPIPSRPRSTVWKVSVQLSVGSIVRFGSECGHSELRLRLRMLTPALGEKRSLVGSPLLCERGASLTEVSRASDMGIPERLISSALAPLCAICAGLMSPVPIWRTNSRSVWWRLIKLAIEVTGYQAATHGSVACLQPEPTRSLKTPSAGQCPVCE